MAILDPRLLSLIGHELRAPVGVIGGYLAMLERPDAALTPAQAKVVDGARRAHHVAETILTDLSRLTARARESGAPSMSTLSLAELLAEACTTASVANVTLTVDAPPLAVTVHADRAHTVDAVAAVAAVVAREHGLGVSCAVEVDVEIIHLRVSPTGHETALGALRTFDQLRAGMGLRLVVAVDHLRDIGGDVMDVMGTERPIGAVITLRRASARATT